MMTDEEFLRIARYMKQRYGIDLGQKKVIMNGRLENHIKSGGWSSFNAFMNDMEQDSSGRLEKELVNLLTTNHTYFMRGEPTSCHSFPSYPCKVNELYAGLSPIFLNQTVIDSRRPS